MVEYEIGRLDKVELSNKELNKQVAIIEKALVIGKKAPSVCPICSHSQSYFEVKAENY